MTDLDTLIDTLAADSRPAARPVRRLAMALALAGLGGTGLFTSLFGTPLAWLGPGDAPALALKLGFGLTTLIAACFAALAAGRPGQTLRLRLAAILAPLILVALAMTLELASGASLEALGGATGMRCMLSVFGAGLLALPGVIFALRPLAPLSPGFTGWLAGLAAGACAASAYALFCPETTAGFMIMHYVPAMLGVGLLGAIAGHRALRW